jgi:phosphohistidine phosphatase
MKYLFILRHAKAAYMEPNFDDFDRPLATVGTQTISILLDKTKDLTDIPEIVLCSAARRTRETLEGLRGRLPSFCTVTFDEDLYLASRPQLVAKIHQVDDQYSRLMLVGHNPGLEQLISWLLGDETDSSVIKSLPTCGFVKIALDVASWALVDQGMGRLKDYIVPEEPQ